MVIYYGKLIGHCCGSNRSQNKIGARVKSMNEDRQPLVLTVSGKENQGIV
jgi:hypothetical protein